MTFQIYDLETAPESSKQTLRQAEKAFGMIPNILGVMAGSPSTLRGYMGVAASFQASSFDATERQIVLLTTSFVNGCTYCMAAHSVIAGMEDVPEEIVKSLREGEVLTDSKLQALRSFSEQVVRQRGWLDPAAVAEFLAAGYSKAQVLEVVLGITQKTLSNYVNHMADTPVDTAFENASWSKPEAAAPARG